MKEARGTEFIKVMAGAKRTCKKEKRKASHPTKIPVKKAVKNPRPIFPKEVATERQKAAVGSREARAFTTWRGPAKRIWLPTAQAPICQRASQKRRTGKALRYFAGSPEGYVDSALFRALGKSSMTSSFLSKNEDPPPDRRRSKGRYLPR